MQIVFILHPTVWILSNHVSLDRNNHVVSSCFACTSHVAPSLSLSWFSYRFVMSDVWFHLDWISNDLMRAKQHHNIRVNNVILFNCTSVIIVSIVVHFNSFTGWNSLSLSWCYRSRSINTMSWSRFAGVLVTDCVVLCVWLSTTDDHPTGTILCFSFTFSSSIR